MHSDSDTAVTGEIVPQHVVTEPTMSEQTGTVLSGLSFVPHLALDSNVVHMLTDKKLSRQEMPAKNHSNWARQFLFFCRLFQNVKVKD
jgi:hypothetical protein